MKFFLDFFPLVVFFLSYHFYDLTMATIILVIVSPLSFVLQYFLYKHVAKSAVISNILLIIMGCVTIFSGDNAYIKMKLTLLSVMLSLFLAFGFFRRKYYIKGLLGKNFDISEAVYRLVTIRIICFFIFIAFCNELIWRFCLEKHWVYFKAFGISIMLFLFMLYHFPILKKHLRNEGS